MSDVVIRKWEATIARQDVAAWVETFRDRVLDKMRGIAGFRSVQFLVDRSGDPAAVTVLTTWDSMDAIHRFAGADPAKTVLPDFMAGFFPAYEDRATFHNQVLLETTT